MATDDFLDYMVCDSEGLMKGRTMKKCLICAEEIQDEAIKCKHCGSLEVTGSGNEQGALESVASYRRIWCLFLLIGGWFFLVCTVISIGASILHPEDDNGGWQTFLTFGAITAVCFYLAQIIHPKKNEPSDNKSIKKRIALTKFFQSWQFLLIVFAIWLGARFISNAQNENKNNANAVTSSASVVPVGAQRLQMPEEAWGKFKSQEEVAALRNDYFAKHANIPIEIKDLIINHYIFIGMETGALIASWGGPKSMNKDTGTWGVHQQWEYHYQCHKGYGSCQTYVYIENGVLTSWQEL